MKLAIVLLTLLYMAPAYCQRIPDAPSAVYAIDRLHSESSYPRAWFVLKASALAAAIVQDGRSATSDRYNSMGAETPRISGGKYAAIHGSVAVIVTIAAWRLECSPRRPVRLIGHSLMWAAVGYHAGSYFSRRDN